MKKFFSKVLFASDSAGCAVFAFTLVTAGNWLWFSFFHLLMVCLGKWGRLYVPLRCFAVGAGLIALYFIVLSVAALCGFIRALRRGRRFRALWYLVPAALGIAVGAFGVIRFFPPIGVLYCFVIGIEVPPLLEAALDSSFRVAPAYCAPLFFLSLLFLLAGGLLPGAMCAAAEGRKFRSAFGRATLALWGTFALWHLLTLGLALYESHEAAVARRMVERRFGRPLDAAGLEAMYREGGKVDAAYWARLEKLDEALAKAVRTTVGGDGTVVYSGLPDRPAAEDLALFDRLRRENRAVLDELEGLCDAGVPLPEKKFVPGSLAGIALPGLQWARRVADLERDRLIRALAVGDAETAWTCYRRIGNVAAYLEKEPALIGALVWIHIGKLRLNCIEKLLDSRLLADDKLDRLAADLAALERAIPRVHERSMYSEAVFQQDIIFALEEGLVSMEPVEKLGAAERERSSPGAFAPYRWIFPVGWYHAALDKKSMLQLFLHPDFRHFPQEPENDFFYFGNALTSTFGRFGDTFYAFTARVRGMGALLRAERYRRRHGGFPKTLDDLPEDPFTGGPLVYEVGPAAITEAVWEAPGRPGYATKKRTADAVSVRSGAETLSEYLRRDDEAGCKDDTRALIRK